jgi:beta-aspartyl-peptidase (threonine type)
VKETNSLLSTCIIVILIALIGANAWGPRKPGPKQVLDQQLADWNAGDLDRFMETYLPGNGLTFFSGGTVTRGWDSLRDRYRTRYQVEGRSMGKLEFSEVKIDRLARDAALVTGNWSLAEDDGSRIGGLFTLVLRDTPGAGWKIVHDHTSSTP